MEEKKISKHCDQCNTETIHVASEDALEIEYQCTICGKRQEVIKSFF